MLGSGQQALLFLINTIFGIYIICLMLRFLLQWVKADFYNPICQVLMRVTNPGLLTLRRFVPGLFGLDLAAVLLMLVAQIISLVLVAWLVGFPINGFLIVVAVCKLVLTLLNVYFFAILIMAIMSWVVQDLQRQPIYQLLWQLNEPILRPLRRILPTISGIDFVPLLAMILIQVVAILLRGVVI